MPINDLMFRNANVAHHYTLPAGFGLDNPSKREGVIQHTIWMPSLLKPQS